MIVLDEQLYSVELAKEIEHWYPGQVISIKDLRPQTLVKDDAIDVLLRAVSKPTFATINVADFWKEIAPDARYCIVCMEPSQQRTREVPQFLRRLLSLDSFNTKAKRMGAVIVLRPTRIEFYRADRKIETMNW